MYRTATYIERARQHIGLNVKSAATKIGISQSEFMKHERGDKAVPEALVSRFANTLQCSEAEVNEKSPVGYYGFHDVLDKYGYFGEVVVHPANGGDSQIFPVTLKTRNELCEWSGYNEFWLMFRTLSNQLFIAPSSKIAFITLAHEASDTYGSEPNELGHPFPAYDSGMSDNVFWDYVLLVRELLDLGLVPRDPNINWRKMFTVAQQIGVNINDVESVRDELIKRPFFDNFDWTFEGDYPEDLFSVASNVRFKVEGKRECSFEMTDSDVAAIFDVIQAKDAVRGHLRLSEDYQPREHFINLDLLEYLILPINRLDRGRLENPR